MVVREVRGNGGEHERCAGHCEDDKGFAAALCRGKLGANEFDGSHGKQRDVSKGRVNGLKFQATEQQHHIQNGGSG